MRVLATDPGYARCGIAIIEGDPSRPTLVWSACITPQEGSAEDRLAELERAIASAIHDYAPDVLGIETLFFGVNKKTAIGVAQARGIILGAAGQAHIPVIECTPMQVKLAVTGYGTSDKKAVTAMVPRLVTLPVRKRLDDELDAIAVGITALAMARRG